MRRVCQVNIPPRLEVDVCADVSVCVYVRVLVHVLLQTLLPMWNTISSCTC